MKILRCHSLPEALNPRILTNANEFLPLSFFSTPAKLMYTKKCGLCRQLDDFLGRTGLIRRDGIHSILAGAACISRNLTVYFGSKRQKPEKSEFSPGDRVEVLHTPLWFN